MTIKTVLIAVAALLIGGLLGPQLGTEDSAPSIELKNPADDVEAELRSEIAELRIELASQEAYYQERLSNLRTAITQPLPESNVEPQPESAAQVEQPQGAVFVQDAPLGESITVPESHAKLLLQSTKPRRGSDMNQLHAQLEQEERDYAWAYQAETDLTNYIAGHPAAANVEVQQIQCRSSMCEIQGVIRGDREPWNQALTGMREQPFWNFNNSSSRSSSDGDGNTVFVTIFSNQSTDGEVAEELEVQPGSGG